MPLKKVFHFSPSQIIIMAALFIIGCASLLLSLPAAQVKPIPFIDVLFTAISATTATGLFTVPLSNFTLFGQACIICFAQIGAIGLVLLAFFLLYLFIDLAPSTELLAAGALNIDVRKNVKKLILFVMFFTITIEFLGALSIFFSLKEHYPLARAWFLAIFHAISAFANAGFSLFDNSLQEHLYNPSILLTLNILMIIGGLGFITLREGLKILPKFLQGKPYHFSLGSKISLKTTALLLSTATLLFAVLEYQHALSDLGFIHIVVNALFNATAFMGTGFSTLPTPALQLATLLIIMIVAFIGTSPGSTGSGIRTTTTAIFLATLKSFILGKPYVELQGERIPRSEINTAIAIIALSIPWIFITTFILLLTEPGHNFIRVLFEAVSAFATLGLSLGITPTLSAAGKVIIMLSMFLGKIGPFTIIFAIRKTIIDVTHE